MIAIIIPTLNRSKYLRRALEFYQRMDFDGIIYVADSSDPEEAQKNNAIIADHNGHLYINYHWIPAPHDGAATTTLNKALHDSVRYVTFAGDDDFQVPIGLKRCAEFLDTHPDYVACHGHRVNFTYDGDRTKLLNMRYGYNWDASFTQLDRVREYLRSGIALASYLHRKDVWIERYKVCDTIPTRYLGGELVQECTTALLGKVGFLSDVVSFLFYQDNPDRVFSFQNTTLFSLMNTPEWYVSFNNTLKRLTELMEEPNEQLMYQELYFHIVAILSSQFQERFGVPKNTKTSHIDYDFGKLAPEIADLLNMVGNIVKTE